MVSPDKANEQSTPNVRDVLKESALLVSSAYVLL